MGRKHASKGRQPTASRPKRHSGLSALQQAVYADLDSDLQAEVASNRMSHYTANKVQRSRDTGRMIQASKQGSVLDILAFEADLPKTEEQQQAEELGMLDRLDRQAHIEKHSNAYLSAFDFQD